MAGRDWTTFVVPWPASNADDIFHPGFDYSRFNVAYCRSSRERFASLESGT